MSPTGMLSLPLAAYFLDDPGTENWIVPGRLLVMAAIGAGVAAALPALARAGAVGSGIADRGAARSRRASQRRPGRHPPECRAPSGCRLSARVQAYTTRPTTGGRDRSPE
jgi:hypothetical protein